MVTKDHVKGRAKRVMRVASVFAGAAATAAAFAPSAAAKSAPTTHRKGAAAANAITGWVLDIHVPANLPAVAPVYACLYLSGRTGHLCSSVQMNGGRSGQTFFSAKSGGTYLYGGHIMLIWYSGGALPVVNFSQYLGPAKIPQYKVTAQPGQWNQCDLPNGGGQFDVKNVYAGKGISNCLVS